ncbi:hypothetical protein [Dyadobacter sp. CY356]|uniref:hypothetical protein n=1 Tax=Dyadobacter sp. CY356 TaxID=2906442 RepID=UPI001F44B102|nr:hypothetical protein [Dyadobacter sp. CY356]MCF0059170.1 hypothetical protein [Dyadobacter sp. CY356]
MINASANELLIADLDLLAEVVIGDADIFELSTVNVFLVWVIPPNLPANSEFFLNSISH